jgi:hypothetical protein
MGKFWDARTKAIFRRQPLQCTVMIAGYVIWYAAFFVLTVPLGGFLIITGREEAWVQWWLP